MRRLTAIAAVFSIMLLAYAVRLVQLQVFRHDSLTLQSQNNYLRQEVIRALRGEVRTRDGMMLATNRISRDLIIKGLGKKKNKPIYGWDRISYVLKLQTNTVPTIPGYEQEAAIARNLSDEQYIALAEYVSAQPNLEIRERLERVYPQGKLAANLLGYVSEANEQQVQQQGYQLGDIVGMTGLEASQEHVLKGRNGYRQIEVDSAGRSISVIEENNGVSGSNIVLTLDSKLQKAAEKALDEGLTDINKGRGRHNLAPEPEVRGAIIAIDPSNGEVLALASRPTFNPNWFAKTPAPPEKSKALLHPLSPMLNRVVQPYAPGSVFKPTTTNAILEAFNSDPVYTCVPGIFFGGYYKKNWATYNMGPMDGRGAIAQSCNTWYYQSVLGSPNFGYDTRTFSNVLVKRAKEMGFGHPTGIELIGEKQGSVMGYDDFKARDMEWYPGMTANISIGQGDILVTPAQVAFALATLVNNGTKHKFTVLKGMETPEGLKHVPTPQDQQPDLALYQKISGQERFWQAVKQGMAWTTLKGTSKHILGPDRFTVRTGGKTGTAQTSRGAHIEHSWYEGYGPIDEAGNLLVGTGKKPLLVVALFEFGGEGSGVALPAVHKVMAAYWGVALKK